MTWTGQPVIWERPDGVMELIFGATDARLHFLDPKTGEELRDAYFVGAAAHIKGTPTLDPDGYPLIYFGARDHRLRIVALDREEPEELWSVSADDEPEGRWWHDWDGSARVVNDLLFEGCENSFYYVWKLNRAYDADGNVTVDPELIYQLKTYDQALLDAIDPDAIFQAAQATGLLDSTGIFRKWYGRWYDRGQGEPDRGQFAWPDDVPAACGALLFCRKKALDQVALAGGAVFDPDFFLYKEDIELCLRLRKKGWLTRYEPGIKAWHGRGWRQRGEMSLALRTAAAKSEIILYRKHPSPYLLWALLKYLAVRLLKV